MTEAEVQWVCLPFPQLSVYQLYDVLKLRQDVFILEQTCLYPDIDTKDKVSHHLLGYQNDLLARIFHKLP